MAKYTPMIEQYLKIKAEVPDAFLFFRLGDFYEMFFDDAILASKELEITLTGRDGGGEERIPMCGVPYHSAESYISKLIEKGYKVAICEQVEDPAEAKGVVRREIVRIVTPGTVMEGKTLGNPANNFIVCALEWNGEKALSACDMTTGELYLTSFAGSLENLADEMAVYSPSEIIGDAELLAKLRKTGAFERNPTTFTEWTGFQEGLLERQFDDGQTKDLSPARKRCLSILLAYLHETQKRSLQHITRIRTYEVHQFMTLDPFTRRNLEITETVRDRSKKGSLLWLLDQSVTAMGSRLLKRWLDKPLMNKTQIESRLEAVEACYHQLVLREEIRRQLKEVYDIERLLGRISYGNANARDLVALKHSLAQIPKLKQICLESPSVTLRSLAEKMDTCDDIRDAIEKAIVDEPPVSVREGGMIRPGYNAYLDQLREASVNGKQWIAELEKTEREKTGIKSLKVGYNKVFGYYIEVTKANLSSLPEGRYERKQTLANAERFVTPELKEKEALILEAEEKMADLEYELFSQLRAHVFSQVLRLQRLAEMVAEIDVYQSLATVSAAQHYCKPEISEDYDLIIQGGRHPVVEVVLSDGAFVANDTNLTKKERMYLITGPNMAGKSTYMRQVALICFMAQIGCFVPAKYAKIPIVDRIFTRIGAADDLTGGQSTFMVEMMDIKIMTENATERSLVIIDELGRGTSTAEGMAIAQAVIEFLHHQIGCKTLVSTHFHELAHLEESLPFLSNYCMAVKEKDDQVTFLRKLVPGAASTSYGIYCAEITGLSPAIIRRAQELLADFSGHTNQSEAHRPPADGIQLTLFDEIPSKTSSSGKKKDRAKEAVSLKEEHLNVLEQLKRVDLMRMTPLESMNFLYELKQKLSSD